MSRRTASSRTAPLRITRSTVVVLATASSLSEARRLANRLVRERTAACINVVPKVDSLYWWKGRVERGTEALLIIKTRRSRLKLLNRRIQALHSYEVPEVLALPVSAGSHAYLRWLEESLMISA